MTYYHPNKQAALDAGNEMFGEDWCVAAQFEPGNGFVVVLTPKTLAYLRQPLEPILEFAEIHITHSIRRRPASFKPLPAKAASKPAARPRAPVAPPPMPPKPPAKPPANPPGAAAVAPPPPPPRT